MPQFASQPFLTQQKPPVADDAAADASADGDVDDMPMPLRRAFRGLRQRGRIGIIADKHRQAKFRLNNFSQRDMMPALQIGRRHNDPADWIERPRRRNANPQYIIFAVGHNLIDIFPNAIQSRLQALIRQR